MGNVDSDSSEGKRPSFELEEEPESLAVPPPTQRAPAPPSAPYLAKPHASHGRAADRPRGDEKGSNARFAFLDDRRRRRLLVYGSVMLILYLLLGWLFAGAGLGWFALAGIGVGLFAGWRQRGEVLLGSVAAVAGLAACLLAVGVPLLFVIVGTGMSGYIAGIDDRLRNA